MSIFLSTIQRQQAELAAASDTIAEMVQTKVDEFWKEIIAESSKHKGFTQIGVRLMRRETGMHQIVWFSKKMIMKDGKRRAIGDDIKRGRLDLVPERAFKKFAPWEREIALPYEYEFSQYRKMLRAINDAKRSLEKWGEAALDLGIDAEEE